MKKQETFNFKEGSRSATVESLRGIFSQKITTSYKEPGLSMVDTNKSFGLGKKSKARKLEKAKRAAQDYCKKGLG
jgi:hypothetical protein